MTTTLRSDRRTQRTARFNLEYLDDRIVPSAIGAKVHLAAAVSMEHGHVADKEHFAIERHAAPHARTGAGHEGKVGILEPRQHQGIVPLSATTIGTIPSTPASTPAHTLAPTVTASALVASTAVSSPTATPASLISSTVANPPVTTSNTIAATAANASTSNPLPATVTSQLQSLYSQYEAYESSGGSGTFSPTGVNGLVINGTDVGINVHTNDSADYNTVLAQLQSDGLQVTDDSATYGVIGGMVPIADLPAVAQISAGVSVAPMVQPSLK